MAIHLHQNDLPNGLSLGPVVAIDTETMGLNPQRDRLCLVQLSSGDGNAHLVQIARGQTSAPNLVRLLTDPATLKLFHFGRFDIAALQKAFGVATQPVWCTKIAAKLIRTFTDRHGLKYLLQELVGVDVSKQQQTSDWGAETLSPEQLDYAVLPGLSNEIRQKLQALAGEAIKVWAAQADGVAGGAPGEVLAAGAEGIRVATGAGVLVLTELQRAGGKRLPVADFLRGFPLFPGQVLDAAPALKAGD